MPPILSYSTLPSLLLLLLTTFLITIGLTCRRFTYSLDFIENYPNLQYSNKLFLTFHQIVLCLVIANCFLLLLSPATTWLCLPSVIKNFVIPYHEHLKSTVCVNNNYWITIIRPFSTKRIPSRIPFAIICILPSMIEYFISSY